MKHLKNRPALLLAALLLLVACGDDAQPEAEIVDPGPEEPVYDEAYFDGAGFILPDSHVNVVRVVGIADQVEPGVAQGFDLDNRVSAQGDEASCGHSDLTDPDGREGIDNQMAKMWPALEPLVGEAVEGLLQGAINEGRMLMMLEISEVDDLRNDDDVTFRLYSGLLDPDIGTLGLIAPDQTFYYNYERPTSTVTGLQIVDGELVAGPVALQIPLNILDARFNLQMHDGWARMTIHDDGTITGVLAGAFHVPTVLGELLETGAAAETRLVTPIFEANADMGLEDGKCTLLSTAFTFEATTAYVVRDPSVTQP